jgi:hypothetical protein
VCSARRRGPDSIDRGVGHQAVRLEIADLRPGLSIPGELNRSRGAVGFLGEGPLMIVAVHFPFLQPERNVYVSGVLHLRAADRHAGPGLWTND